MCCRVCDSLSATGDSHSHREKENGMKNHDETEQQTTRRTPLIGCVTALSMALALALPQAARAQSVTPPPVPANLQVPAGNEAFLLGRGVGTQNYVCQPAASLGHVAWTLFTPQATLLSDQGEQLTSHFFSPNPFEFSANPFANGLVRATWVDSRDTSSVWARAISSATVSSDAIPWVLLQTSGVRVGPTGGGTLAVTTFIQRLNTFGGLAPATGCDGPADIGNKAFVPYTADYFFYKGTATN
jgi:hypothetical protein